MRGLVKLQCSRDWEQTKHHCGGNASDLKIVLAEFRGQVDTRSEKSLLNEAAARQLGNGDPRSQD